MRKVKTDPDLQSQLESLLDQVWRSEADWRLWDRVDALVMMESLRVKRAERVRVEVVSADPTSDHAA
jgi:hypothetical protein